MQIVQEFVSADEENEILQSFNWQKSGTEALKNRQVCHFGKEFVYGSNTIADNKEIEAFPTSWTPLIQRSIGQVSH